MGNICPIYKMSDTKPWDNGKHPNAGLRFDKFADAWNSNFRFDEDTVDRKTVKGTWLGSRAGSVGEAQLLKEACTRQRQMVQSLGGLVCCFKNVSRFMTGLGRAHPLENGFTWHHTLGVPFLPGSSLKGLLRSWSREETGVFEESSSGHRRFLEDQQTARQFGSQEQVGDLVFLDMLPMLQPRLVVEVMTPHYGPYYQSGEMPGDWHSPIPIKFLATDAGFEWQVAVLGSRGPLSEEERTFVENLLTGALEWSGAGAKTAVGYGRFERITAKEELWKRERQKQVDQAYEAATKATERAGDSTDLWELKDLAEKDGWENNERFQDGVNRFLEGRESLAKDAGEWLRQQVVEKRPGLWENPDAVKKPPHKPKWVSLVKRIKGLLS